MKKERIFWFSGILSFCMMLMLGMSLAACSNDDEEQGNDLSDTINELFEEDDEVGPSFENPYVVKEENFRLQFQLWPPGDEKLRTEFDQNERIIPCLVIAPSTNFECSAFLDDENDDLKIDKHFFAVYTADGKLVKTIKRKQIEMELILTLPGVWEITYVWDPLPPGDYYTKFTVKYNSTPGAEEKVWKTHTFRMDFKVVDNNH